MEWVIYNWVTYRFEGEGELVTQKFVHENQEEMEGWLREMAAEGDEIVGNQWRWIMVPMVEEDDAERIDFVS